MSDCTSVLPPHSKSMLYHKTKELGHNLFFSLQLLLLKGMYSSGGALVYIPMLVDVCTCEYSYFLENHIFQGGETCKIIDGYCLGKQCGLCLFVCTALRLSQCSVSMQGHIPLPGVKRNTKYLAVAAVAAWQQKSWWCCTVGRILKWLSAMSDNMAYEVSN